MSAQNTPMVMIAAAARALCHQHAAICNVNADDLWNLESESLKEDAQKALEACGAPALLEALVVAREFVSTDRNSLADSHLNPVTQQLEPADVCADYDAALLQIDAAIRAATGGKA